MHKHFGIWLITSERSFFHPAIWREDANSYAVQTRLQRIAGVRYVGTRYPKLPDGLTGFGETGRSGRRRSIARLFKGQFDADPVISQSFVLRRGHRSILARATGYAIISSKRLRGVSIPGAVFVGTMKVRVDRPRGGIRHHQRSWPAKATPGQGEPDLYALAQLFAPPTLPTESGGRHHEQPEQG